MKIITSFSSFASITYLFCAVLLSGCISSSPEDAGPALNNDIVTDVQFAGIWEKNYGRSDNFNEEFRLFLFDVQRGAYAGNQAYVGDAVIMSNATNSSEALTGLARFTEELTRLPLLEIEHDGETVYIERPNDFPLHCRVSAETRGTRQNTFGVEQCAWNEERLLFRMALGKGLVITQQYVLSPEGSELSVVTTVNSPQVAVPLTISNYYERITRPADDYGCIMTLTRQSVCSQYGL